MVEIDYKMHKTIDVYKRVNNLRGKREKKEKFLKNNDDSLITT